jgi:hypothetical protein
MVTQFEKTKSRFKIFYGRRGWADHYFFSNCVTYKIIMDTLVGHSLLTVVLQKKLQTVNKN